MMKVKLRLFKSLRRGEVTRRKSQCVLCLVALTLSVQIQSLNGETTVRGLRDAILGETRPTSGELGVMDLNQDGRVDVADLVKFIRSNPGADADVIEVDRGHGNLDVVFDLNDDFTGTVNYDTTGTAIKDTDYSIVDPTVNGKTITFNVNILTGPVTGDDQARVLFITLKNSDSGFSPLRSSMRTIIINENKETWNVSLASGDGVATLFKMTVLNLSGQRSATVTADGKGGLPAGEWPVSEFAMSEENFKCVIGPVTTTKAETLFNEVFKRVITLTATAGTEGHAIDLDQTVKGSSSESISCEGKPQFNRTAAGSFSMIKSVPVTTDFMPTLN